MDIAFRDSKEDAPRLTPLEHQAFETLCFTTLTSSQSRTLSFYIETPGETTSTASIPGFRNIYPLYNGPSRLGSESVLRCKVCEFQSMKDLDSSMKPSLPRRLTTPRIISSPNPLTNHSYNHPSKLLDQCRVNKASTFPYWGVRVA